MGKLEQYVTKDTKKEREPVYAQENSKTLQGYNAAQTLSGNELIDKYQKRIQGDTTFEDRTRYYFEDYHLMDSKVKRYRNMAKDERGLQSYSHTYNNHKASKRKDFANAAADKFEAASKLALSLDESKTKGFALYQHREKIMRLRMSGMENAAKAKSVSSDDEAYKILKGKLSCLSILKDQLEVMGQDESLSAQEIVQFKEAKARIDSELEGVKNSLMSREKIHVKTWERENGLDDSSIRTKLRNEQRTHPYVKSEAVKLAGIMNRLDADDKRMEYEDTVPDMLFRHPAFKDRKDNRADIENVDSMNRETVERFGRILRQPCRVVLRDRNGLPVSHAERRKEEWNKKWLNAVKNRDKDTINSMLKESFERFEKMEFPSPEELRSKGIMYFYKKDPAAFHEMMRFTSALDEMAEANDFAKEYRDSHELFRKKTRMALCMSSMLRNEIAQSRYMINKTGNGYGFVDIRNQAQYREYRLGDEAKANAIQRDLAKYTADHQSIQEAYRTAKTEDMKKAEEHTDTVNDMKGELDLTIKELRREKARSGKTISPELEELDKDIVRLESQLRNKIPLAETADREKGFDYTILMIETMYNRVSSSVDRCLAKSSSYKGLRHGRLMLDKMKRQCAAEIGAFRSAAVEYRRAIQEGSIGPFDKGQEPTWRDALNYTRSVIYDLDKKGEDELMYQEDSGNNSEVVFIENKTARNKNAMSVQKELHGRQKQKIQVVFKAEDIQRKDTINEMIASIINSYNFGIEDKALEAKLRKDLIRAAQKDRKENGDDAFCEACEQVKDFVAEFTTVMTSDKQIKAGEKTEDDEGNPAELSIFRNLYSVYFKKEYSDYRAFISEAMTNIGKASFHRGMAGDNARIKDGRNISSRNVATSRMATLLGIENQVCDSRNAYLRRDGKLIKGIVMENSRGKDGRTLANMAFKEKKKIKYSDEVISQLFTIQMFDALCGQIDRNLSNVHFEYKVEGDTYILTNARCLDNDLAFGNKTDITQDFNQLRAVSERNLMGLPIEMLNRFMGMNAVNFKMILGDLLEKDEIDALSERLDIIKDTVRDMENKGILEMYRGQYRYADEKMRDDKTRQLQILKEYNAEAKKNHDGKIYDEYGHIHDKMHTLSLFDEAIIAGQMNMDPEDALNRMIMERKDGPALLQSGMETEKKTEKKTIPPLSKQEQEQIKQLEKMEAMQRQQYENEQRQLRTLFEKGKGKQIKLQSRYDRQGTNNCFACSGTALLNHFIAKNRKLKPGEKLPQYNQYDMRNINPDEYVQSYAESWENYNSEAQYSNEVSQLKHMVGPGTSGLMEIFELGDFFLREEKDLMIHQKKIHVDYENKRVFDTQKKAFADQVKEVLDSGEPVALFEGSHYVTITGLKGNIIEYMDSNDDTQEEGKPITKPRYATIDDIFSREKTRGAIGITWLSKLKDPKDIVKDFQYLGHNGKEFYSRDTDGDTYNLTHKHGLTGVKEMGNGITYDIYVPKNSAPISKTGSDMNIIMEEPEEEEIIEKHSIQRKSSNIKKEKPAGKNDILVEVGNRTYNEVNKLDKAVTEKAYRVLMEKRECEDYILKNPEVKDAYKKATENIKEWSTTLDRNALYVMKYVKMDKNGNPATKEDRINHEWNIKWLKAFHNNDPKSLQTREDMLGEQIGHVMDEFLLPKDPTPEMLKDEAAFKKHIDSWIENTLMKEGNFAKLLFINKCPYSYDGLKLVMPGIKGFLENNKALQAKEDVMTAIMSYANSYILLKYHIQMEKDSVVRFSKDETGAIRQNNEMLGQVGLMTLMGIYSNYLSVDRKKAIVPYKKALVPVEEKKKEGKKETGNDSSQKKNKESYEINPNISLEEFLKADPSLTGEAYDIFMGHIKAKAVGKNNPVMKNEYQKIVDGNKKHQWLNIDRDAGYMLKYVNYDKNNKPLTKVDQENHEWNLRWFQCLQKEDKKSLQTRKQMTTQYASHIYDDLPLPPMPAAGQEKDVDSYMKVLQDWAESILKDQDAFAKLEFVCEKTLSFDNMSKAIPGLKTYKTKNKKFEAKQNMALALGTYIKTYISKKYGMDVSGQRVFTGETRENWVRQADGALKIYAQVFMDAYRQYNEHNRG